MKKETANPAPALSLREMLYGAALIVSIGLAAHFSQANKPQATDCRQQQDVLSPDTPCRALHWKYYIG